MYMAIRELPKLVQRSVISTLAGGVSILGVMSDFNDLKSAGSRLARVYPLPSREHDKPIYGPTVPANAAEWSARGPETGTMS